MITGRDVLGELVSAAGRRTAPPREDYEYVLSAARQAWQRKLRSRRRRGWALIITATVMAASVGGIAFFLWMPRDAVPIVATTEVVHGNAAIRFPQDAPWRPLRDGDDVAAGSRLRTGAAAGLALELEGGISVRLDRQSELELASSRAMRLIAGTVYVDCGPSRFVGGLRVETHMGTVTDVGTVFEIRSGPDSLRIRVREGRIQLDASGRSAHFESAAGDELALGPRGAVLRRDFPATDSAWAWAEALATAPDVEGRPLVQFLAWVARETGRRLQFQGPDVEAHAREVVLHGKTRDLAPLQALDLMLSTTDLEYVLAADESIVIRRRED